MRLYNIIDEQGRFCGFKADTTFGAQADSHTMSTKYMLEQARTIDATVTSGDLNDNVWRRKEIELQIADMRRHYQLAVDHNVVPPQTPLRTYVSQVYMHEHSIMPALFRHRLVHGQLERNFSDRHYG